MTLTSASRMLYAFARDGGVVASARLARVHPQRQMPITAVCTLLLYASYVLPTLLGLAAHGRSWTAMGPWQLGRWYRPLALLAVVGCGGLFVIGVQPPNEKALGVLGAFAAALAVAWWLGAGRRFRPSVADGSAILTQNNS